MTDSPRISSRQIEALSGKRVLVVGDVMLDTYLTGDADRISPEAPVPVVRISGEERLLGGAGNVAANIAALGGQATLIGIAGADSAAEDITNLLNERSIRPALAVCQGRRTTVKTRVLARRQQMLRLDQESDAPLSAEDLALIMDQLRAEIPDHDVLILSDYAKGLISQAFVTALRQVLDAQQHPVTVLVDPKPQHFSLFQQADLLTPNLKETSESVNMPARTPEEILAAGREIFRKYHCRQLLSTLGPLGMALFLSPEEVWHIPTVARDVFDVTGAGDTVIAAIGLALAAGLPLLEACILANCAAGIVVGKVGAATVTQEQLRDFLGRQDIRPARWS